LRNTDLNNKNQKYYDHAIWKYRLQKTNILLNDLKHCSFNA